MFFLQLRLYHFQDTESTEYLPQRRSSAVRSGFRVRLEAAGGGIIDERLVRAPDRSIPGVFLPYFVLSWTFYQYNAWLGQRSSV